VREAAHIHTQARTNPYCTGSSQIADFAGEYVNHKIALPGRKTTNEHRAGRVGTGFLNGKAMKSLTATRVWMKSILAT